MTLFVQAPGAATPQVATPQVGTPHVATPSGPLSRLGTPGARSPGAAPLTAASLIAALALVAGCNKAQQSAPAAAAATPSVAVVNGTPISRTDYDIYVRNLLRNSKQPQTLTPEQQNQVLDDLISIDLLASQGEKDGLQNDPDTKAQLELLHMRVMADAESQKFLKSQTPSDAELHTEYDAQVGAMDKNEYHARHILVATKEQGEAVIKKLKGGAKFEDVAKAQSTDTGSKNNGGDLGWFTTSRMVKPFADAVKGLKKGEITPEPVQTQYGWHVIQLEDTREAAPPPFDQVKSNLTDIVARKKLQAYVAQLKSVAKVEKTLDTGASGAPASPTAPAPAGSAPPGNP
jgi:peptidyl-prolyl cis-trans isomerase C